MTDLFDILLQQVMHQDVPILQYVVDTTHSALEGRVQLGAVVRLPNELSRFGSDNLDHNALNVYLVNLGANDKLRSNEWQR